MNFVTESKKHQKLETLSDCLKTDRVTNNLWVWAERLEKFGKILFWLIIIFGIITTVTISIETKTESYYSQYFKEYLTRDELKFNFEIFITGILETALYAFIEYCAYHVLALLISALANITQSTKTVARITEYLALKQYPEEICDDVEEQQKADDVEGQQKVVDEKEKSEIS